MNRNFKTWYLISTFDHQLLNLKFKNLKWSIECHNNLSEDIKKKVKRTKSCHDWKKRYNKKFSTSLTFGCPVPNPLTFKFIHGWLFNHFLIKQEKIKKALTNMLLRFYNLI